MPMKPIPYFGNYSLFTIHYNLHTQENNPQPYTLQARKGTRRQMTESIMFTKSKAFALRIVRLYKHLRERKESVIAKQMLRAGTSIGANIAESRYAQSKTDFASKLQIALKEAAETEYWLELLRDGELVDPSSAFDTLLADCTELIKLLTASVKTAKT